MFDEKELSRLIGCVVHESACIKRCIENHHYYCKEELESIKAESIELDILAVKISNLLNK